MGLAAGYAGTLCHDRSAHKLFQPLFVASVLIVELHAFSCTRHHLRRCRLRRDISHLLSLHRIMLLRQYRSSVIVEVAVVAGMALNSLQVTVCSTYDRCRSLAQQETMYDELQGLWVIVITFAVPIIHNHFNLPLCCICAITKLNPQAIMAISP